MCSTASDFLFVYGNFKPSKWDCVLLNEKMQTTCYVYVTFMHSYLRGVFSEMGTVWYVFNVEKTINLISMYTMLKLI